MMMAHHGYGIAPLHCKKLVYSHVSYVTWKAVVPRSLPQIRS